MSNHHKFKDSKAMAHCDFEDETNTLKIKFHSGDKEHCYLDCPRNVYDGLKAATSAGQFFHTNIRGKFKEK